MLGVELMASGRLDEHSPTEQHPQPVQKYNQLYREGSHTAAMQDEEHAQIPVYPQSLLQRQSDAAQSKRKEPSSYRPPSRIRRHHNPSTA